MKHEVHGLTDVGSVRDHNEDSYVIDKNLKLYVVCDGLGGHAAGEVASQMACKVIVEHMKKQRKVWTLASQSSSSMSKRDWAVAAIEGAIHAANRAILKSAQADKTKHGMGCTVVLVMIVDEIAAVAHVGDSRIYLLRDKTLYQLTEDHSVVDEQFRRGKISLEAAVKQIDHSSMTRAVGTHKQIDCETLVFSLMGRDRFLLCSDGLTRHVRSDELETVINKVETKQLPKHLIALANERGGYDNITAINIEIGDANPQADLEITNEFDILKSIPIFKRFDTIELMKLISVAITVEYKPGQTIMREGSHNDRLHVCIKGKVELTREGVVIGELGSGDFFGEMSMIDKHPAVANANAKENCRILVWGRNEFFDLIERDRYLASRILWRLCLVLNQRSRHLVEALSEIRKTMPTMSEKSADDPVSKALRKLGKSTF